MTEDEHNLISLTAEIVSAHVAYNTVAVSDLSNLIAGVHASLAGLGGSANDLAPAVDQQPAVPVRASIKADYLVCLEDGKRMKVLKGHLMTSHQLTPAAYRTKWKLPADYPMAAAEYVRSKRAMALQIGLGKLREQDPSEATPELPNAPIAVPPESDAAADPAAAAPRTRRPRLKIAIPKV